MTKGSHEWINRRVYRRGVGDDNVEWTAWGTVTAYLPTFKTTDR